MKGNHILLVVAAMLMACSLSLTGCGKKKTGAGEAPLADNGGIQESLDYSGDGNVMEGRTSPGMYPVYFAFDSSTIEGEQESRMETNAQFLANNPEANIRIEGNCDPRGTKEYNLALGERRAQSAKRNLINKGIDSSRLTTISFGEEKLLLFGNDESSWAQNRRDDFVIK